MGMRVESAEERLERLEQQVDLWRNENDHQAVREQVLRQRLDEQLANNRRCVEQLAAAEQRIGHLAKLQAAVRELHEATLPADVLTAIKEIVANLIGCEEMGIYARRPRRRARAARRDRRRRRPRGHRGSAIVSIRSI